jgi:hypothetical protein
VRADLSAVIAKKDQVHHAVNGMQGSISDINLQMTAMADALKSLRSNHADKSIELSLSEHNADEHPPQSSGLAADQPLLLQKHLEVDNLRYQYALEQELSRCLQQQPPATRRSAPPGFGRHVFLPSLLHLKWITTCSQHTTHHRLLLIDTRLQRIHNF